MKIRKDITIEYQTMQKFQSLINLDPALKGNFSAACEKLIDRELREKNLETQRKTNVTCISELPRQTTINEYTIKPNKRFNDLGEFINSLPEEHFENVAKNFGKELHRAIIMRRSKRT